MTVCTTVDMPYRRETQLLEGPLNQKELNHGIGMLSMHRQDPGAKRRRPHRIELLEIGTELIEFPRC